MSVSKPPRGQSPPQVGAGFVQRLQAPMNAHLSDIAPLSEIELERSQRVEAERVARLKDEFLANLSHELRTPLNAILGWSQILRPGKSSDAEMAEGLEIIQRNVRVQVRLIDDLLDMSRIVSGKLRLDVQRLDLAEQINISLETVRLAAEARQIRIRTLLDPIAAPIAGDPARMQQVIWNLLSNAIKFTPIGGLVQVVLERVSSHVQLSIIDSGRGIEPALLPFVFDRFRQGESCTGQSSGLGIGLAIVKCLVEMHGGSVNVKSAGANKGSTFIVALPISVVPDSGMAARNLISQAPIGVVADPSLRDVQVLVVDDDCEASELVQRVLRNSGAIVKMCASADQCMEALRDSLPDVLISDISMPEQDGYDLIKQIRSLPAHEGGELMAVALTGYARSEDRRRALLAGFDMHIAKPFEPGELVAAVARLARRGSTHQAPVAIRS